MSQDHLTSVAAATAVASLNGGLQAEAMHAMGVYELQCFDADGNLKWSETVHNLVTTQGRNYILDTVLSGNAYTAAWYLGLFTAGTPNAGDTYASQTAGGITQATNMASRPAVTWGAAASGSKASAAVACNFNGSATITGVMLVTGGTGVTTVGNTSATGGVLLSEGTLGTARSVINGDTLNVTYSLTV